MIKIICPVILVVLLASCSSLEQKSTQLDVGSSKLDVANIMGPPPYKFTHENVDAWRYAVVAGFGYCDYREFYIYRNMLIYKNDYHRASIAGCTAGLKNIDWELVLGIASEYDTQNPTPEPRNTQKNIVEQSPTLEPQNTQKNIVEQLKELNQLKESGVITEEEFKKAKQSLLK